MYDKAKSELDSLAGTGELSEWTIENKGEAGKEDGVGADGKLTISVDPDATQEVQLYVTAPKEALTGSSQSVVMTATNLATGERAVVSDHFFGP